MIEVEKKFQPTEEQLKALLEGAEFLGEKINHDIYYDFPDYSLIKAGHRLRKRNFGFELKVYLPQKDNEMAVAHEFEDEESIKKNLGFSEIDSLKNIIESKMQILCDFKTKRKEYKKENFTIDIDETDFGYSLLEVEFLVENEEQIKEAEEKIFSFIKKYGIEIKNLPLKTEEYLKIVKPYVYKQIFKENKTELKIR